MTYRILDTFCGAGGAGFGYHLAGFEVVGVDIAPQKHYPFEFHQADALEYIAEYGREFDAIHASPPCQGYSRMRFLPWLKDKKYPLLIEKTREILQASGKFWVIENVMDAPLAGGVLCGASLGFPLSRHRRFETNVFFLFPVCPGHPIIQSGKAVMATKYRGHGITGVYKDYDANTSLGIDWMTKDELAQAIPPAYTKFIGEQLIAYLEAHV